MARDLYPRQTSGAFTVNRQASQAIIVLPCLSSCYAAKDQQWTVVVVEENLINHGRATSKNGQASRCRHCCASWMTQVNGQSLQQMRLSENPNDAWASRALVSCAHSGNRLPVLSRHSHVITYGPPLRPPAPNVNSWLRRWSYTEHKTNEYV